MALYEKNPNYNSKLYNEIASEIKPKSYEWSKQYTTSEYLTAIYRFTPMYEIGYTVIAFKGTRIFKDDNSHKHITAIYAIVYLEVKTDGKTVYITPRYICPSPTYTSRDGEYRQRFIPFKQLLTAKTKFAELWDAAEEYIMDKIIKTYHEDTDELKIPIIGGDDTGDVASGDLIIHAEVYPSADDAKYEKQINEWANDSRMAIHLLIAAWLCDGYNIFMNIEENHINYNYKMMIYDDDDAEFFKIWTAPDKKINLNHCRFMLNYLQISATNVTSNIKLGVKITPLTVQEVATRDVALGVWKEIILSKLCTNLTLNGIAPSFGLYYKWSYINNVDRNLFDNVAMHEKYENLDKVIELNDLLKKARELTNNKIETGTADLSELANKINETIVYSNSYSTFTDVALISISEWQGYTIRDIPALLRQYRAHGLRKRPAEMNLFNTAGIFVKYIFDLIFSLNILNTKFSCIHGDLHTNNITIQQFVDLSKIVNGETVYVCGPNPMAIYLINSLENNSPKIYAFDSFGFNGSIIDYSRAIIADLNILRTIDADVLKDTEFIQDRQRDLLLRLLHKTVPDIVNKHELKIKALLIDKFDMMHKIAAGIDYFYFSDNIYNLLIAEFPNAMKKHKTARDFHRAFPAPTVENLTIEEEGELIDEIPLMLANVRDKSHDFVITNLLRAINNDAIFPEDISWIGNQLIDELFDEYLINDIDDLKDKTIYDVYDSLAPIKYSCVSPDCFPQKIDVIQKSIENEENIKWQKQHIDEYKDFLKDKNNVTNKLNSLLKKYEEIQQLPIETTWKYENT